jgi:hypothetical protein
VSRGQSAWRRRSRRNVKVRAALGALTAVAAVAAVLGCMALVDDHVSAVNQAAYGSCASAGAGAAGGGAAAVASAGPAAVPSAGPAAPCPTQSATGTAATGSAGTGSTGTGSAGTGALVARVSVSPRTFSSGPIAQQQLGDVATAPVDGQGNPISLSQSPDQASGSGNCTLIVPANPLTAAGLATPYQLADGCSEANQGQQAFVEATILSPGGQVQVYNPLVVTQGTTPAAPLVAPRIPRGAKVILDFGFNGTNLVLTGPGAGQSSSGCVDALGQSVIGQVSACGAVPFYALANSEIARGILRVPPRGTATDGQACPTTRDFALIDQDQSDNIYSQYLLTPDGRTAQATPANKAALSGASLVSNGSDNALLGYFVDPANGCKPFTRTDRTSVTGTQSSQALDELSARVNQKAQIAVTPTNDEMVLVNGAFSVAKTNMYRSLVDQPQLAANTNPYKVAAAYCMNMVNIAPAHNQLDMNSDAGYTTPVPAVGDSLATFLGNRLSMSFANLGCASFGLTDPVNVTADGNGVATAVGYSTAHQQATLTAAQAGAGGGNHRAPSQGHGHRHRIQDPSGM